MWRKLRIAVLLVVLGLVAAGAWLDRLRTTSWEHTVWVGAFPVNADGSVAAAEYIAGLSADDLQPVSDFIAREARRHGVMIDAPIEIRLYPPLAEPPPPLATGAGLVTRALWSLRLRHYRARAVDGIERARPKIALFLLYHDPARAPVLPHSLGLQRGLTGVVQLFATRSQSAQNAIVTAHELLHTFGATDKYSPDGDEPLYPQGFAEPERAPRYPQRYAEIMAGRVPLAPGRQEMPADLSQVRVGAATAREIGWSQP
ncbi:MAG: hypothetical protein KGL25_05235 [Gammaproteobacteria bacterium]|nr:hypothetical protein [Gammaproteobacteria bacterium]